ncbi:MAG TPA: cell division protein FtsZ [Bacteroidales bacterium]
MEDLINFDIQANKSSIIKVIGVGGGGSNAVNHMFRMGIKDVDFIVCNTDAQALANSPVPIKIQLGNSLTEGRGAGNKPDVGRQSAIESLPEIMEALSMNTKMAFITAGMGGGTGTGAAPVIAKAVKEQGILTVGIVTIPFRFEGPVRINQAIEGINELRNYVDSLLVIHNEKLRELYGNLKISEAFSKADNILTVAAKGIAEIITVHGYVNVDFADVQTIMANSGVAIMGSATASGQDRALEAIQQALTSPLLNNNDIRGAKSILLNITSGEDEISMDEVGIITDFVVNCVDKDALMIWGTGIDPSLNDKISVTIIATGFPDNSIPELITRKAQPAKVAATINEPFTSKPPFEVKHSKENFHPIQKTIEFDFGSSALDVPLVESPINQSKANERLSEIKKQSVKPDGILPNHLDPNVIEELENTPAFMRKNIKLKESKSASGPEISRLTLFDSDEDIIKISAENPYLNKNVD